MLGKRKQDEPENVQAKRQKTACSIPPWTVSGTIDFGNCSVQSNSMTMSGGCLLMRPDGRQFIPPPVVQRQQRSTVLDRSTDRYLWIDAISYNGQITTSDLFLCSAKYIYEHREDCLALGHGVQTCALPLPVSLPVQLNANATAFDFDLVMATIQSLLSSRLFPAPLQRIIVEYAVSETILLGVLHDEEYDYINIACVGESNVEIMVYAMDHLAWSRPPNKFIPVKISRALLNDLPSQRLIQQHTKHPWMSCTIAAESIIYGV